MQKMLPRRNTVIGANATKLGDHEDITLPKTMEILGCTLKNLCSHSFDSFDGTTDHISAQIWLNDVEELLEGTRCTANQKGPYTVFKLSREAIRWCRPRR
ncbi:hypothetical protein SLA2020_348460 [Shorea laevis]